MPILENVDREGLILVILIAIVCWWLMMRATRRARKSKATAKPKRGDHPRLADGTLNLDAPPEFHRWQVELHETARDAKAELDTKLRALQGLVATAEQVCGRLETLLEESRGLPAAPNPNPPARTASRYDEIYALADGGLDPASIARQVNSTTGEVELILSLRGKGVGSH